MKKVMDVQKSFEKVEKQEGKPFVGAKIYEHMENYKSHVQGDVEVVKLPSSAIPKGLKPIHGFNGILAEGLANSGHHVLQSLEGVEAFFHPNPTEYDGPILQVSKSWTLTHPNHKWATFPAGCYQVKFPGENNLGQMRKQRD